MRKRFIIVGLGTFGSRVAEELFENGHDVIAIDLNAQAVDRIATHVSRAAVGDARAVEVLDRLGARQADAAIVSTGEDLSASILSLMALRDLGVTEIYVKVTSQAHARVMNRLGATQTIIPEHESARNLATVVTHSQTLLNYVQLSKGFSIQEMAIPKTWEGQSLRALQFRRNYGVSVVAVRDVLRDELMMVPDPDAPLKDTDTLLLAGRDEDLERLAGLV